MRSFIATIMFMASFSSAMADDYVEVRDLNVSAAALEKLIIDVGAGTLDVTGVDGLTNVEVKATIVVPNSDADDGRKVVTQDLTLSLERDGDAAVLKAEFEGSFWGFGRNARVDIEVRAPTTVAVKIDDGSGSLDVRNFAAEVRIDDGSGSIDIHDVGDLHIDDGSGSIDIGGASGDVFVNDGSGSITIEAVSGSVTIDDGSGGIRVRNVAKDLIILGDGSGDVSYSDVRGTVEEDT